MGRMHKCLIPRAGQRRQHCFASVYKICLPKAYLPFSRFVQIFGLLTHRFKRCLNPVMSKILLNLTVAQSLHLFCHPAEQLFETQNISCMNSILYKFIFQQVSDLVLFRFLVTYRLKKCLTPAMGKILPWLKVSFYFVNRPSSFLRQATLGMKNNTAGMLKHKGGSDLNL